MEKCLFRIKINEEEHEFNSEEELNSFLRANKRTLSAALLSDKVLFSNDRTKQQQVFQELRDRSNLVDFQEDNHKFFLDESGKPVEYTPVTKLMADKERLGYFMVKPFNRNDWAKNQFDKLMGELNDNREQKYTKEQANAIIAKMEDSWQTQSLLGTSWHKIAQAYFEGKIETEKDIVELFPNLSNLSNFVLTKYITSLKAFKERLQQKFPNAIFLTEANMFDHETKVAGIADLLVIDELGKVHIFDYKTSTKDEAEWNQQKNLSNRYQLAFYRQMLRRAGYIVDSTHTVPIMLREVDWEEKVIRDFDMGNISTKYYKEIEPLMQNVKKIMPYTLSAEAAEVVDNTNIHKFIKEAFNYTQKKAIRGSKSVDEEYERMLRSQKYANAKEYYYYPLGNFNAEGYRWSKTSTVAELKANIAEILKELDATNAILPTKMINFINDGKKIVEEGGSISDVPWSAWSKNDGTNIKVRNLTFKYIMDPAWEVLQSDALSDLNILAVENTKTNEVDFITLSSDNLDNKPQFSVPKATTILGNFLRDDKAATLGITNEATNGDVELMKTYAFIKANKSMFVDKKIGSLFALNIWKDDQIPSVKTQILSTLELWHNALEGQMPKELGIPKSEWTPQQIDKSRAFITYISDLLENKVWKNKVAGVGTIKGLLKDYNDTDYTLVDDKIAILDRFIQVLKRSIDNNLKNIGQSSDNNDIGLCIKLATEAILQLKKIPTTIEKDLKQYGYILNENANTTSPKYFRNLAQQNLVSVVTDTMNNVRSAFLHYVDQDGGLRDIHDKLYTKMGSIVNIKALGYNLDIHDKMLEHSTEEGKPMMRFKDPDDPANKLNEYQKNYITSFLTTVNKIRVQKLVDKKKYDANQVAAFLESPEARNIPLLKAGTLSAFKGKNLKQFTDDFFRELMNPNNIFKEDAISKQRIDDQSSMFNAFDMYDIDMMKRAERIDNAPEGEFETDLELVLATYMMSHFKEQEVNKKLPIINAIKNSVMINEIYGYNPTPNLDKLQTDYVATTIFGKNMLSGESENVAKFTKALQESTSMAVMSFSWASGITEMVSGFFGNVVRLMANKYTDHNFGFNEYLKAHAIVAGTVNDAKGSYKHVSYCDAINEIYGLSEMDIARAAHEVQAGSSGLSNFRSKYAYWFNTFPGYFNRLVLFNAQAIKDGVLDIDATGHITKTSAYQMIDGKLVYNENLDKRFKLYTNAKNMPESKQTSEYKEQKALYLAIKQDLADEPHGLKADGTLNKAYNNKQRTSLKAFADDVHGSYDKEDQTNFQKMAFGRIMMQFKGWITAKKNRWYTETQINQHKGRYEMETDLDGNPVAVWKGKVTEGIAQTICAMYHEISTNKFNIAKSWDNMNPTQKENFMFLLGDTLVLGLLTLLVALFSEPNMKETNPLGYQAVHSLRNSSQDFFIGSTISAVSGDRNPLALAAWSTKVVQDTWSVATGQDDPTAILKNVAVYRNVNNLIGTDK